MIVSRIIASVVVLIGLVAGQAFAVIIETVPVGNPGNAADTRYSTPGYGSVGYTYQIGKYDVTTAQYAEFLNAVAATDTYGLYSASMDTALNPSGCNIKRIGSPGSYAYTVGNGSPTDLANWGNRPVNLVSWGDAARFANWLYNGQPSGPQGLATTEDGSYYLNGTTSDTALMTVTRKASATWAIPTEYELYKAAYYDTDMPGGAGYWDFPTRSNTFPSNVLDPNGTNNVNYYYTNYTIGAPYWRTNVGAFAASPSAYGTYDQGGNVWQWNEAKFFGTSRGLRGGSYRSYDGGLFAVASSDSFPSSESYDIGFRVSEVPEPASIVMLSIAGLGLIRRR